MTRETILNNKVKGLISREVSNTIKSGIAFHNTNQSAFNPSNIKDVVLPEEDIILSPQDNNFTVVTFVVIIEYNNGNQISFPGIGNLKL